MKKERKIKSEKIYLKKGYYPLNDIYYDIFLERDGNHYFSFVNKQGRTVLLNSPENGFKTLAEAESLIKQILQFAKEKNRFDIKSDNDGKFYFNLYNEKGNKIARSFYFKSREEIENSINEFLSGHKSSQVGPAFNFTKTKTIKGAEIIPISQMAINEKANLELKKKREEEQKKKALLDKKWKEEKQKLQAEKERKAREREILLADKKEKRRKEQIKRENEKIQAATVLAEKDPMKDDDLFDGCFRWLWIILILLLLALLLSYFKGCFGSLSNSHDSENTSLVDSQGNSNLTELGENKNLTSEITKEENQSNKDTLSSTTSNSIKGDPTANQKNNNTVLSQGYEKSTTSLANCNCSANAIVFNIPNTEAKKINRLGTNPQFGNSHGLSSADFLEDLKYRYENNAWDRTYLNYLYKAMGYQGFQDARASQFSQEKLQAKSKGILGFGGYSGYAYSELNLKGKDLEVFRVEAANGCHINFMKTCGNLFFMCE